MPTAKSEMLYPEAATAELTRHRGPQQACFWLDGVGPAGSGNLERLSRGIPSRILLQIHTDEMHTDLRYQSPIPLRAKFLSDSLHKITCVYATLIMSSKKHGPIPSGIGPSHFQFFHRKIFSGGLPAEVTKNICKSVNSPKNRNHVQNNSIFAAFWPQIRTLLFVRNHP
jgi:hypothetical protein